MRHDRLYVWAAPWGKAHYIREGWRRTLCGKPMGRWWVQLRPSANATCGHCQQAHAKLFIEAMDRRRRA